MSELQLPRGSPLKSFRGPASYEEMSRSLQNDAVTGFIRASIIDRARLLEGIVVFLGGKPVLALTSENNKDRVDPGLQGISGIMKDGLAVIEIFSLKESQACLLMDFGKPFILSKKPEPHIEAEQKNTRQRPTPKEPKPVLKGSVSEPKQKQMPLIRGRFVRSESVSSFRAFLQSRPEETGHAILIASSGGVLKDYHLLIIKGSVVGAYSDSMSGKQLLDKVSVAGGQVEFYRIEEQVIASMLKDYPHISTLEKPAEVPKKSPGVPASDFYDRSKPSEETLEDDIELVKKVETEFAGDVEELLRKLELSHLRVTDMKKGRP